MSNNNSLLSALKHCLFGIAMVCGILVQSNAHAFTVKVVDDTGQPISAGFRWTVEEDNTFHATPGVATPTPGVPSSHTVSVNIHKSHHPLVATGTSTGPSTKIDIPSNKRYFVSVLPDHTSPAGTSPNAQVGWTQSGRGVDIGQGSVTVVVHHFEPGRQVPTAQITALVFEDNDPINGALDQPAEHGLAGFTLVLSDPVGKVMQDAWLNPVGTTYLYAHSVPGPNGTKLPTDVNGVLLRPEQQPEFQLDADGLPVVDFRGDGNLYTCPGDTKPFAQYTPYEKANCVDPYDGSLVGVGEAVVRYLTMNKYTIEPVPPNNDPDWIGPTATLEGTRGNDAWVRAGEPRFNIALGQLNWLVFYGFVKKCNALNTGVACHGVTVDEDGNPLLPPAGPGHTITGQVVYVHDQHPPLAPGLTPGLPVPDAFIGLNNLSGADEQVFTAPCIKGGTYCDENAIFTIPNVPPGIYQLVMWDKAVDGIIDFRQITVTNADVAMGKVAMFGWFGTLKGNVFNDKNGDGIRQPATEPGLPSVPVNIRFADGSMYANALTDPAGDYAFGEYFPWWRYLVAEIDSTRFKATGMTSVVDDGGLIFNPNDPAGVFTPAGNAAGIYPGTGDTYGAMGINPQIQPDGKPYRTEKGPVITEALWLGADMTSRIDWGKSDFAPGENGGIKGQVNYATTRTEEDPQFAAIDGWEPGIPRVQVNLYKDLTGTGQLVPGQLPVKTTFSNSWDDNNPTGCVNGSGSLNASPEIVNGIPIKDCAETIINWDQTRPGVYDGLYSFSGIPSGRYIVQVVPPKGYEVLKWGDRNIEFGDPKLPFLEPPPECVGDLYPVPQFHTLFPDQQVETAFTGGWTPDSKAPLCDRKLAIVSDGRTFVADFHLFTFAPRAAQYWGAVFDDLTLEFNPNSPNSGSNLGAKWVPVSLKDYKGVEVARAYTDQYGHFDALIPSNYDIAPPIPLGLVLSLYSIFPNDPGPVYIDPVTKAIRACDVSTPPGTQCITDPFFNPTYSVEVIRENWEVYPGRTTFVDTIVLSQAAFVANATAVNCDFLDHVPELYSVNGPRGIGPLVSATGNDRITIRAVGKLTVPNPDFDPLIPPGPGNPQTITRDHSFGPTPGSVTVNGVPLVNLIWATDGLTIAATVPPGIKTGQLIVTRGDNHQATTVGVTLHVDSPNVHVVTVTPPPTSCYSEVGGITGCRPIQDAIDSPTTLPGDLILIQPGTYIENVILWKPVQLQGWGSPATVINNILATANFPLKDFQFAEINTLLGNGDITIVPGQEVDFTLEQGAGILVASCDPAAGCPNQFSTADGIQQGNALIDGLTVTGATEAGGGVLVDAFAPFVKISNNEIFANQGSIGGGIRFGTSSIADPTNVTGSSFNQNAIVDHNRISQNGSLVSGGGGIAIYTGTDNYRVTNNFICGNFSFVYGGGIGHFGLSDNGLIQGNMIVSNESFDEGGGIHIGGELVPAGANLFDPPQFLTLGTGNVIVNDNLIQGNKAGDDGGGIRTLKVNGEDVRRNPGTAASATPPSAWYEIDIFNNMIVDNSSADVGGGISLDDTVKPFIVNNTVARNDSTSTGSDAFGGPCTNDDPPQQFCPPNTEAGVGGGLTTSIPQVGGIASFAHSTELNGTTGLHRPGGFCAGHPSAAICANFANPVLQDDIIWQNRSFYWDATINSGLGGLVQIPALYWDLAVYGVIPAATMSPTYSMLTLTDTSIVTSPATNLFAIDPLLVNPYFNIYKASARGATLGNFVVATFTPNGLKGDYHIQSTPTPSPAIDAGGSLLTTGSLNLGLLRKDFDGNPRPLPPAGSVDIGADEVFALNVPVLQLLQPTPTNPPALNAGSLDFGTVGLYEPVQRTVVIVNSGQQPLIVASASTGNSPMFTVINWPGMTTVPPGETMTITVEFTPTAAGPQSATLTITSNSTPTQTATVALTGTGL
jgi:hypothetical protein